MGVWIETGILLKTQIRWYVTPFVGVWIETDAALTAKGSWLESHPSWVCGLKLGILELLVDGIGHTLRGCVD